MGADVSTGRESGGSAQGFAKGSYEASKSAFVRADGLCCRPNCYVQQWRGSNGEESAYCSKMCANNHTAGFKDPTTRERDAIVSEFYGALNTAVSAEALNNLQKDWANTAVSLNLTDALLHEIQQVYQVRLFELLEGEGRGDPSRAPGQQRRVSRDHHAQGPGAMPGARSQPPSGHDVYPLAEDMAATAAGAGGSSVAPQVHVHVHVGPGGDLEPFPPPGNPHAYADTASSAGSSTGSSRSAGPASARGGPAVSRPQRRTSTEQVGVKVMRGPTGFGIVLGLTELGDMVVTEVKDRSPATGKLRVGDLVIKVSGRPTRGRTHAAVIDQLKKAKTAIFMVQRKNTVTVGGTECDALPSTRPSAGAPLETRLHALKKGRGSEGGYDYADMENSAYDPPAEAPKPKTAAEKRAEKKAAKKDRKRSTADKAEEEVESAPPPRPAEEVGVMYTNPLAPKTAAQLKVQHKDAITVAREKMHRKEITRAEYNAICIQVERAARAAKK